MRDVRSKVRVAGELSYHDRIKDIRRLLLEESPQISLQYLNLVS